MVLFIECWCLVWKQVDTNIDKPFIVETRPERSPSITINVKPKIMIMNSNNYYSKEKLNQCIVRRLRREGTNEHHICLVFKIE